MNRSSTGTWTVELNSANTVPPTPTLYGVAHYRSGGIYYAWAVGAGGTVLHRGASGIWTPVPSPVMEDLKSVATYGASEAWAVGRFGTVIYWDGASWKPFNSGTTENLNGVAVTEFSVYIAGDGGTLLRMLKQ